MSHEMMALQGLLEKTSDANLLREILSFAADRPKQLEVGSNKNGARWGEKCTGGLVQRSAHRDRVRETHTGTVELPPKSSGK